MPTIDYLHLICERKVVAIMRAKSSEELIDAAEAICLGGISVIEVTMTTPGALQVIEKARAKFKTEILFGAGSVLDAETARAAILAGAQFVVCPTLKIETINLCKRYGVPVMPGAYTPTEILTAWENGADIVKIFPTSVGGPAYIKAIKAPLPQVRVAAVGGVNLQNTADFFKAGCEVIGVGSELVSQDLLNKRDFETLTERARNFLKAAHEGTAS